MLCLPPWGGWVDSRRRLPPPRAWARHLPATAPGGVTFRASVLKNSVKIKKVPDMRPLILIATAMIAVPSLGSAQSVLERVIGQIDNASNFGQVNGTYANIAESVGAPQTGTPGSSQEVLDVNAPDDTRIARVIWNDSSSSRGFYITAGMIGTTTPHRFGSTNADITIDANGEITDLVIVDATGTPLATQPTVEVADPWDNVAFTVYDGTAVPLIRSGAFFAEDGTFWYTNDSTATKSITSDSANLSLDFVTITTADTFIPGLSTTIDGSITNIITGVTAATAEAAVGVATATEFTLPTFDLGDMATTALGAVNTGEITLGVNSAVDEASTSTTNAISAVMTQIGGSADTGALVLNVASNASAVQGSIENTMASVNGSIGNLSTTALGAVNTGTIASGVDAAVAGIVGTAGQ